MTQFEKLISNGMEGFIDKVSEHTCPHIFGLYDYSNDHKDICFDADKEKCKECFYNSFGALVDESEETQDAISS